MFQMISKWSLDSQAMFHDYIVSNIKKTNLSISFHKGTGKFSWIDLTDQSIL